MTTPLDPRDEARQWRMVLIKARAAQRRNPNDHEAAQWGDKARTRLVELRMAQAAEFGQQTASDFRAARDPGALGAAGLGFSQGATFGFGDEAAGLVAGAGALLPGGQSPAQAYRAQRGETLEALEGAREARPLTTLTGDIAGSLATPIPALRAGARLATRIASPVLRGATRVGAGMLAGAGIGGAHGFGRAEGGPVDRVMAARDEALIGTLLGAFTPLAGAAWRATPVRRYIQKVGEELAGPGPARAVSGFPKIR